MSRHPESRARPRLRCTLPLLLVLVLPAGLADSHGLHGGPAEAEILTDARHRELADHWEAVETVEVRRCPECLAPGKHRGLAPVRAAGAPRPLTVGAVAAAPAEPARSVARPAGPARAPPLS